MNRCFRKNHDSPILLSFSHLWSRSPEQGQGLLLQKFCLDHSYQHGQLVFSKRTYLQQFYNPGFMQGDTKVGFNEPVYTTLDGAEKPGLPAPRGKPLATQPGLHP
ncbi:Nadh Dehydrogenase [Ubiquinone] 1 Alpha Subcomplex Subunit 10 [Manis pentadactyla]|nr:Nadh Dehydrogenase [Ubiquinone] 1 Alpha Subcomplex Subunit 10 [Manis pentadactyla]